MRNLKLLLATTAFAIVAAVSANAENGFTAQMIGGNRVLTAVLVSGSTINAGPAQLMNCDGNISIYRRSSATNAASTHTVALGADSLISATVVSAVSNSIVASRTDVTTGGQCYAWASVAPGAGAAEVTTIKIIERNPVITHRNQ